MASSNNRRTPLPNTGSEAVPPGATTKAFKRDRRRKGKASAGERHAVGEPGGGNLNTGLVNNEDAAPGGKNKS